MSKQLQFLQKFFMIIYNKTTKFVHGSFILLLSQEPKFLFIFQHGILLIDLVSSDYSAYFFPCPDQI